MVGERAGSMVALEFYNPLRLLTSILHRFDTGATEIESAGAISVTGPGHREDFRARPERITL